MENFDRCTVKTFKKLGTDEDFYDVYMDGKLYLGGVPSQFASYAIRKAAETSLFLAEKGATNG